MLDVVIVRIIEEKMMIVAENSKTAAILLHDGETKIKEGQSLKIIKPILETNEPTTLRQNPRFKLQIQKNPGKEIKIKEEVLMLLIEAATKKTTSANSSVGPSFEEIEKMALSEKSCIPTDVHVVVLTLSRIFSGGHGKCQIANVKDYESKKSSLVLYGPMDTSGTKCVLIFRHI